MPMPSACMQAVMSTGCASPWHPVTVMVVVTAVTPNGRSVRRGGSRRYEQDACTPGWAGICGGVAQLDAPGEDTLIADTKSTVMANRLSDGHEAETPDNLPFCGIDANSRAWMSPTVSEGTGTSVIAGPRSLKPTARTWVNRHCSPYTEHQRRFSPRRATSDGTDIAPVLSAVGQSQRGGTTGCTASFATTSPTTSEPPRRPMRPQECNSEN
jgi:hypothetical protein